MFSFLMVKMMSPMAPKRLSLFVVPSSKTEIGALPDLSQEEAQSSN